MDRLAELLFNAIAALKSEDATELQNIASELRALSKKLNDVADYLEREAYWNNC